MGVETIKRWHWLLIGLALGAVAGYVWMLPRFERDPVMRRPLTADQFASITHSPRIRSGALTDLVVHPSRDGHNFVTGAFKSGRYSWQFYLYADQPFKADQASFPGIVDYLASAGRSEPALKYRYAWWEETRFGIALARRSAGC